MRDSSRKPNIELTVWKQWAETASREEDGWESDAPNWSHVVNQAQEVLVEPNLRPEELSALETVLCLSEEGEALADFLKANYAKVAKDTIRALSASAKPQVRWQVYDSLVAPDEFSRSLLLQGVEDPDDYVRRRAFLRLLETRTVPRLVLERATKDADPSICEAARMSYPQTGRRRDPIRPRFTSSALAVAVS